MENMPAVLPTLEMLATVELVQRVLQENATNRAKGQQLIHADNDLEAVNTWLNEYSATPSTYRVYQKEAERLLLWCVFQHKKALSNLNREDFETYIDFMQNPIPRNLWCGRHGGRGNIRGSKNWKPFSAPLNPTSLHTAITIINSLMTYLVDAGYLQSNPLKLLRKAKKKIRLEERKIEVQARILEKDEWEAIKETLCPLPESTPHEKNEKYRLRFIVGMLYFLGLRVGELTSHTWQAFRYTNGHWWFMVRGKGNKLGKIPVNQELLRLVQEFRQHLRMTSTPRPEEDTPLIPSWRGSEGLQPRAINTLLKSLAIKSAERHFKDNPSKQEKLKKFSAHWLRHLSASQQDRAGIPFTHIRNNLRHENDETTRIYVHSDDKERVEAMERLSW